MRLTPDELKLGCELGSGAQGAIYAVESSPLVLPFPVVFKRFHSTVRVDLATLERLTQFRSTDLEAESRAVLDGHAAWPIAVVERTDGASGYVMRALPEPFWQTIKTTCGEERIPREVQHLFLSDELARKNIGESATLPERRLLAFQLAEVLELLHRHQLVFGDLSYRNAVFALRPSPQIMLLDCDAVRSAGARPAVDQLHSPGWQPPEGGPAAMVTDRYKLGLFVLRILTPGSNAQNRDPRIASQVLDHQGRRLLRRALSPDPTNRPLASDWVEYLAETACDDGPVEPRSGSSPEPAAPPAVGPPAPETSRQRKVSHRGRGRGRGRGRVAVAPPATHGSGQSSSVPSLRRPRARRVHPSQVHTTPGPNAISSQGPVQAFAWAKSLQWTKLRVLLVVGYVLVLAIIATGLVVVHLGPGH